MASKVVRHCNDLLCCNGNIVLEANVRTALKIAVPNQGIQFVYSEPLFKGHIRRVLENPKPATFCIRTQSILAIKRITHFEITRILSESIAFIIRLHVDIDYTRRIITPTERGPAEYMRLYNERKNNARN